MARYIDADKLSEKVWNSQHDNPHIDGRTRQNHHNEHNHFLRMIYDEPTADVVEVVRCKDCKHRETVCCPMYSEEYQTYDDDGYSEVDLITTDWTEDDGFCHCGVKREEE